MKIHHNETGNNFYQTYVLGVMFKRNVAVARIVSAPRTYVLIRIAENNQYFGLFIILMFVEFCWDLWVGLHAKNIILTHLAYRANGNKL